jgi:hypothetical protein
MSYSKRLENAIKKAFNSEEDPEGYLHQKEFLNRYYVSDPEETSMMLDFLERNQLLRSVEWAFDEEGTLLFIRRKLERF